MGTLGKIRRKIGQIWTKHPPEKLVKEIMFKTKGDEKLVAGVDMLHGGRVGDKKRRKRKKGKQDVQIPGKHPG